MTVILLSSSWFQCFSLALVKLWCFCFVEILSFNVAGLNWERTRAFAMFESESDDTLMQAHTVQLTSAEFRVSNSAQQILQIVFIAYNGLLEFR